MGIPRRTIFLILKFYISFKTFIANRFEDPWKWVFRIRLRRKIGFRINSGNAQFLTKSLQIIDQVYLFIKMYGVKGKLSSTRFRGMATSLVNLKKVCSQINLGIN